MKLSFESSQQVLPVSQARSVTALVELNGDAPGPDQPLDLRFVLDRSMSMEEASGCGRSKMQVLTGSVVALIRGLTLGHDQLSIETFDKKHEEVQAATRLADEAARAALCRRIEALTPRGWTKMSRALKAGVAQPCLARDAQRRVVLFTDGCLTSGGASEPRACFTEARRAAKQGKALTVFATGEEYDEAFLRKLVDLAGGSSCFVHVLDVEEVLGAMRQEIARMRRASCADVHVSFRPSPGFELAQIQRLIPSQRVLTGLDDRLDTLDDRGQRYLVRGTLNATTPGPAALFDVDVSYQSRGQHLHRSLTAAVEVSRDAERVSAHSARVVQTAYNAAGVQATMMGDIQRARTLFTQTGNQSMLQAIGAFGSAQVQSAQARKLRTVVSNSAHLQPFGSAAPLASIPPSAPARSIKTRP